MAYTIILPAMKDGLKLDYTQLGLLGTGNSVGYLTMALGSAWFAMKRRGFAAGIVSGGIGAGTLISGLIVPPILSSYGIDGWRNAWFTLGGISFAGMLASLFLKKPTA